MRVDLDRVNRSSGGRPSESRYIMARIYRMVEEAWEAGVEWDEALYKGLIETVKEFDTIKAALDYWEENLGGDSERYGIE